MSVYHDEVEIEDFEYVEEEDTYYYPCPCGDRFRISKDELKDGEKVATCPSCSLIIKIICDRDFFEPIKDEIAGLGGQLSSLKN